jgi:uncharacterized protein (DUF2141 family)
MLKRIVMTVIAFFAVIFSGLSQNHNLTVVVKGADSNKGKIVFALSPNEADYKKKKGAYKEAKSSIENGTAKQVFSVSKGEYAVKVFHDENNNMELDTNFVGIPKESVGFSNNPSLMGMPSFSKVSFTVDGDKTITIELKM